MGRFVSAPVHQIKSKTRMIIAYSTRSKQCWKYCVQAHSDACMQYSPNFNFHIRLQMLLSEAIGSQLTGTCNQALKKVNNHLHTTQNSLLASATVWISSTNMFDVTNTQEKTYLKVLNNHLVPEKVLREYNSLGIVGQLMCDVRGCASSTEHDEVPWNNLIKWKCWGEHLVTQFLREKLQEARQFLTILSINQSYKCVKTVKTRGPGHWSTSRSADGLGLVPTQLR